ncbi:site-specific DNA-methyltransferase [Enterococcus casseliflavus]|uniref:site-specific DNA-methyltransferase n=1 Tax=Enterococcus casseliflavus TaxID=37734 RepID=UPI002DB745B0|nr:DNA methyltransferase [Enterococcus casseliflavus]MEB6146578.1 site-specific DNA-methyltransferase [Enterococcus casseliflavus]
MLRDNQQFNKSVKSNSAFLDELRQKMPEFFTVTKFDEEGNEIEPSAFDNIKFQHALKEHNIDELSSGYRLDFIGKNYAKKQAGERPTTVIVPDNDHNQKEENKNSKNLFFTGDNLEVLRHLQQNYANSVDLIYIDPPYNTGSDGFVYPDKFDYSDDQLKDMFGLNDDELKRLKSIQGKATHSAWLTFMYPRLYLAKKILKDSGVVFVSIDDNEQANLKLLMDEIFGEGSLVAELPTIMNLKGNQDQFAFAGTHEYTLVFAKNIRFFIPNELSVDEEVAAIDWIEDSEGWYKQGAGLVSTGQNSPRNRRPRLWFPIIVDNDLNIMVPEKDEVDKLYDSELKIFNDKYGEELTKKYESAGVEVIWPTVNGREASWRWGYNAVKTKPNEIIVKSGRNGYSLYKKQRPAIGDLPSSKPKTLFYKPEYSSGNGTNELKNYFGEERLFSNPKPTNLIRDMIQIGTSSNTNAIILDFFAGSSTTADAVMQLNSEDGGNRQYIMCTLPEPTFKVNSDGTEVPTKGGEAAYKAGFRSIDEISRERIVRAANKTKEENPTLSETQDFGFKHYRVVSPNQDTLDKVDYDDQLQLDLFDNMIDAFSSEKLGVAGNATGFDTILQTYLARDNYKFDTPVNMREFAGVELPYVNNQRIYLIAKNWQAENTKALVNAIGKNQLIVQTIVVYGYTLEMESLRELEIALNQLENKVILQVRY